MKCYIKIVNGEPYEHPIVEMNFKQAFPDIDVNNLPPEYCPFIRVEPPSLTAYQKNQKVSYGLVEGTAGTYTDIWTCEEMTDEEIAAKQKLRKDAWAVYPNWDSWTFNETTCDYDPPVTPPHKLLDDSPYQWHEETLAWRNSEETHQWNPATEQWQVIEVSE